MLAAIAANRVSEDEDAEKHHLQSLLSRKPCCVFPTKIVILLLVAFLYLLVGGALFSSLELQNERDAQRSHDEVFARAVANAGLNATQVAIVQQLVNDLNQLSDSVRSVDEDDWTFVNAVYFSLTVVTTIGYGFLSPRTVTGQVATVIYATFGIPLIFYIFAYFGRKLMDVIGFRIASLREGKEFKRKQLQEDSILLPFVVANILTVVLICAYAAIYFELGLDGWTYWESCYFVFITMATIGFGDLVPSFRDDWLTLLLFIFGSFLALSVYSYILNVAIVLCTKTAAKIAAAGVHAMDVEGLGHVSLMDVVNFFLGRTMAMRNKHQASLVVRLINENVSVAEKAKIVELWGYFCINTTLMQYKLPRNLTVVALLGGPGSGKTVLCRFLAKQPNVACLAVEDLVIRAMAGHGSRSQAIHAALHAGLLLPEGLILSLIRKEISKLPPNTTVVLDGYPTTAAQAESLDEKVRLVERAIYLDCSEETMQERFQRAGAPFGIWGVLSQPSVAAASSMTFASNSSDNFDASLGSPGGPTHDSQLSAAGNAEQMHSMPVHRSRSDSHVVLSSVHRRHLQMLDELVLDVRSRAPRRQVFSVSSRSSAQPTLTEVKAAKSEEARVSSEEVLSAFGDLLSNFKQSNGALVEFYRNRLHVVNAEQSLDAVEDDVLTVLRNEAAHSVPDNFMQADQGYRVKVGVAFSRHNSVQATQQAGPSEDRSTAPPPVPGKLVTVFEI